MAIWYNEQTRTFHLYNDKIERAAGEPLLRQESIGRELF